MNIIRKLSKGLPLFALLLASLPASGATVSYFLDQSNVMPDGTDYLRVFLSDRAGGGVDFLVEPLAPLSSVAGPNFGIQKFGFNVNSGVSTNGVQILGLPPSWSVRTGHRQKMSIFGTFDFGLWGDGMSRQDPLRFSVTGLSLGDVAPFFAAHVADFDGPGTISSAFFGGGTLAPVPLPGAVWLLGSGLLALFGVGARRRHAPGAQTA